MKLQALALAAVRARAEYDEAIRNLMMELNPLGIDVTHLMRVEDEIKRVSEDEHTCMHELEAIVLIAQGTQH